MSVRKPFCSSIVRSDDPDMITWYDGPDVERAEMPCGHAIGAESLTAYCREQIKKGRQDITCPHNNGQNVCGRVWDYPTVRKIAVLSEEEKREFEINISQNVIRNDEDIKGCPSCGIYCLRKDRKDTRIICLNCSKVSKVFEFCWNCSREWKTMGETDCGNPTCSGGNILDILQAAPLKEIVGLKQCPSIRACPSCWFLIEHQKDCKHMACPVCGKGFCFICLKQADSTGLYRCGRYYSHCTIAPIQSITSDIQTNDGQKKIPIPPTMLGSVFARKSYADAVKSDVPEYNATELYTSDKKSRIPCNFFQGTKKRHKVKWKVLFRV